MKIPLKKRSEFHPTVALYLFTTLCIAMQNRSICVNVVCEGSPSLIRVVCLIAFGITARLKSPIILTINHNVYGFDFIKNLRVDHN